MLPSSSKDRGFGGEVEVEGGERGTEVSFQIGSHKEEEEEEEEEGQMWTVMVRLSVDCQRGYMAVER